MQKEKQKEVQYEEEEQRENKKKRKNPWKKGSGMVPYSEAVRVIPHML